MKNRILASSMLEQESGCWLWLGEITYKGYGRLSLRSINSSAHRAAYEAWKGPIPAGLEIDICAVCAVVSTLSIWRQSHRETITYEVLLASTIAVRRIAHRGISTMLRIRCGNGGIIVMVGDFSVDVEHAMLNIFVG